MQRSFQGTQAQQKPTRVFQAKIIRAVKYKTILPNIYGMSIQQNKLQIQRHLEKNSKPLHRHKLSLNHENERKDHD